MSKYTITFYAGNATLEYDEFEAETEEEADEIARAMQQEIIESWFYYTFEKTEEEEDETD